PHAHHAAWPEKTQPGAGAGSKPNSGSSAMKVAELTVAKYMRRPSPRPSATWRAFLEAHIRDIVAVDFFVVPTLTFRLLFGFLILRHHRRKLVVRGRARTRGRQPPQAPR